MPQVSEKLPKALLKMTSAAKARVFQCSRTSGVICPCQTSRTTERRGSSFATSVRTPRRPVRSETRRSGAGALFGLIQSGGFYVRYVLLALGAQAEVRLGLLEYALALVAVENPLAHNAPRRLRTEVVFAVEALHPLDQLGFFQNARIDHVGKLMALLIGHLDAHQVVVLRVVVELGSGIGVADGYLDGFHVQTFGEIDGVAQCVAGFARQTHDEIAVLREAQAVGVLGEALGPFDGGALLDVVQNLLVAQFLAHDRRP